MTGGVGVVGGAAAPADTRARRQVAGLRTIGARVGLLTLAGAGGWLALASASNDWILDINSASVPRWLYGPLAGLVPALTDRSLSVLLLLMLAGYVVAVACADALPERAAIAVAVALVVLFGLAPPILSSDLFGYVAYARLEVVHGLNPYLHGASAAPHDPIYPFVYWRHPSSPYGPLFTLLTLPFGGRSLAVEVWSLKTLATISCLISIGLLVRAAKAYGRPAGQVALLVGANPLLVVYGVGGGHNDLIVLAVVSGALLVLAREGRAAAGGAALVVATAFKATGGLLLPFALVASRSRGRFVAGALAAAGVAVLLSVVAFGPHLGGTLARIATNGHFVIAFSGPDALGRLLGTDVTDAVRLGCAAVAAAAIGFGLWRVHKGADWLGASALAGLAVLLAIPSLVPWYVAWVLPVAALARGSAARVGIVVLTVAMVLTRLPLLGFEAY